MQHCDITINPTEQHCDITINPTDMKPETLYALQYILNRHPDENYFNSTVVYFLEDNQSVGLTTPVRLIGTHYMTPPPSEIACFIKVIHITPSELSPSNIQTNKLASRNALLLDRLTKTCTKGYSFNNASRYLIRNGDNLVCIRLTENLLYYRSKGHERNRTRYTVWSDTADFIGEGASTSVNRTRGAMKVKEYTTGRMKGIDISFRDPNSVDKSFAKPNHCVAKLIKPSENGMFYRRHQRTAPIRERALRISRPFKLLQPHHVDPSKRVCKGMIEDNAQITDKQMDLKKWVEWTQQGGQLEYSARLKLCIAFLKELHRLHGLDILHKDIKPANVILDLGNLTVKIIDFDLSAFSHDAAFNENSTSGTAAYFAKETADHCEKHEPYTYTAASDLPGASIIIGIILGAQDPNAPFLEKAKRHEKEYKKTMRTEAERQTKLDFPKTSEITDEQYDKLFYEKYSQLYEALRKTNYEERIGLSQTYRFERLLTDDVFSSVSEVRKSEIRSLLERIYLSDQANRPNLSEIIPYFESWYQETLPAGFVPSPAEEVGNCQYEGSGSSMDSVDDGTTRRPGTISKLCIAS
ncbi:MAG TPA: serine/threonine-protein kinase [Gammaproteobacteria bacterium]|jgi:hypothetical protein|nr:serine/threonine-protein kinase [Gammaproteobacteria bacterium]